MAWSYYCEGEGQTLTADTKEDLANKIVQHMKMNHDQDITMQDAMDMVEKGAKQSAA